MIVATAGHVDHGKTTLVKALTGTDTDRLPEEKARGLSIDLGFAYQPVPGGQTLGFVDVPGHEKFIRNMVAGISGIDLGLLVIAADDGVMPQTREHVAILDLMGVTACCLAISKIDRVDEDRVDEVESESRQLLAPTGLKLIDVFRINSLAGTGVPPLKTALLSHAQPNNVPHPDGYFRLAVDRAFTLPGVGLIVTGTVRSGTVSLEDQLVLSPHGQIVRVRGIHAQNRKSSVASAGQRAALNLSGRGLDQRQVFRGNWLLEDFMDTPSDRMDVHIRVLTTESRALKHWTPVHVHLGTAHTTGRVAPLQTAAIQPGQDGLIQLVLDQPQRAAWGDRLILRDQSARRTMGGGFVVDPCAPKRGRRRSDRLDWLQAMTEADNQHALQAVAAVSPWGVAQDQFCRIRNLKNPAMETLAGSLGLASTGRNMARRWHRPEQLREIETTLVKSLSDWHRNHGEKAGATAHQLQTNVSGKLPMSVIEATLDDLVGSGQIMRRGSIYHQPAHQVALSANEQNLWNQVSMLLTPKEGSPMSLHQIADSLDEELATLDKLALKACRSGLAFRVAKNRYLSARQLHALADQAVEAGRKSTNRLFSVASFRDQTRLGRNFVIDLLEYFDRVGLTERLGNQRRIRRKPSDVFPSAESNQ